MPGAELKGETKFTMTIQDHTESSRAFICSVYLGLLSMIILIN